MNRFYSEYINWEDYLNGMYDISKQENESSLINSAINLLSNRDNFKSACISVITHWPVSTKVNLTNNKSNRRAWLGQASCNFIYKVPEILTRIAWSKLTILQQNEANEIAEQVIKSFEINHEKKDKELY